MVHACSSVKPEDLYSSPRDVALEVTKKIFDWFPKCWLGVTYETSKGVDSDEAIRSCDPKVE